MPANTTPIFPITPVVSWGTVTTANTAKDGTGTMVTVFTAGANGARIDQIKVRHKGANVATALRFFINNGNDASVAANNSLVHEATIALANANEAAALADFDITIPKNTTETACPIPYLPPNYKLNIAIGTTVAAGLQVTVFGGNY
ncbi:hypothetical protein [Paenibacillus sp. NFR01]|uniref:hypothetical protein n=1 Tax=Paenibacillus sp. NFR01 TaxID=1566279 RepID=UPI0008C3CD15|nr:hypothetical protein [Paenibacillus sp. NFR01]SEU32819.1 hypothetical protein SAMN03159358_0159 [Paenibacillus sp. NFR01]